ADAAAPFDFSSKAPRVRMLRWMKDGRAIHVLFVAAVLCWSAIALAQPTEETHLGVMTLNVSNMPNNEVVKLMSENGGLNVAIGTGVTGQVTLFVKDYPIRKLLDLVVDMTGSAYSIDGGVVRIMTKDAFEELYGRPFRDQLKPEVLDVQHLPVQDVLPSLTTLRSKTGQVIGDNQHNRVYAIETPYHVEQMKSLLSAIDHPLETHSFPIENGAPDHVADRLRTYLPATAKVEADAPGKRLLVTADHAGIEQADRVLSVLSHGQEQETRAFTLAYAGPDSVKKAIQAMLSTGVGDT